MHFFFACLPCPAPAAPAPAPPALVACGGGSHFVGEGVSGRGKRREAVTCKKG